MAYYGGAGGGSSGGTNDHRLLTGRTDAKQHPATAISINAATLSGVVGEIDNAQAALEMLSRRAKLQEITATAATAIGTFRAVAFRPDDQVELADHDTPAHLSRLAGITLNAVSAGTPSRICVEGTLSHSGWQWTPGAPVFVGRNGELTQSPPTSGFLQHLGFALGRDSLLVQVERPIRRN